MDMHFSYEKNQKSCAKISLSARYLPKAEQSDCLAEEKGLHFFWNAPGVIFWNMYQIAAILPENSRIIPSVRLETVSVGYILHRTSRRRTEHFARGRKWGNTRYAQKNGMILGKMPKLGGANPGYLTPYMNGNIISMMFRNNLGRILCGIGTDIKEGK